MDYEILFEFIPKENKKYFLAWVNAFLSSKTIVAVYRAPFEEKIFVSLDEYELRLKEKERNNKLNNLGIC